MRTKTWLVAIALLLATPLTLSAAEIYAVHGINGKDLGLKRNLPVDVSVDGACALPNFRFGDIAGPVELPEGTYTIAISLRDRDIPCSGPTAVSGSFVLEGERTYSIVAHLDEDGVPTASQLSIDRRPIRDGFGRLMVVHGAVAPKVDITLNKPSPRERVVLDGLANGSESTVSLAQRIWQARIYPALGETAVAGPLPAPVVSGNVTVIYAVGSLAGGTFDLLAHVVPTRD